MVIPKFYFIFWKPLSGRYVCMHDFGQSDVVTSSYWHLNSKSVIFIDDVIFVFAQMRLSRLPMINFLPDFDML